MYIFRKFSAPAATLLCAVTFSVAADPGNVLKVCADPSNLPLSNDKGEGYENKIAEALAHDLGRRIEYAYFPQRMGFVRNTLRMKDEQTQQWKCDVIIGVPKEYDVTATTHPYMHSTYALIFSQRDEFKDLQTAEDLLRLSPDRLAKLRIGVFSRSPGNDWLLKHALMDHAAVFSHQNGDAQESPARTVERELAAGKIDAAILWGPMAGMLASQHKDSPQWRAVPFTPDHQIRFDYEMSMGLRNGEKEWKDILDGWIAGHQPAIDAILKSYQIPIVDATGQVRM